MEMRSGLSSTGIRCCLGGRKPDATSQENCSDFPKKRKEKTPLVVMTRPQVVWPWTKFVPAVHPWYYSRIQYHPWTATGHCEYWITTIDLMEYQEKDTLSFPDDTMLPEVYTDTVACIYNVDGK